MIPVDLSSSLNYTVFDSVYNLIVTVSSVCTGEYYSVLDSDQYLTRNSLHRTHFFTSARANNSNAIASFQSLVHT
jgi:hypothetical protein